MVSTVTRLHAVDDQPMRARPTVLLADDHPAILSHVTRMLEEDFEVLGAVSDGKAALRESERLKPDVIVLDIAMGVPSGIEVALQLRDTGRAPKIVFLTVHDDSQFVSAALSAGGTAYVVKHRLGTDLVPAIRAALAGNLFVSAFLLHDL